MFSCESARFDATYLSASAAQLHVRVSEQHQKCLMGLLLQAAPRASPITEIFPKENAKLSCVIIVVLLRQCKLPSQAHSGKFFYVVR